MSLADLDAEFLKALTSLHSTEHLLSGEPSALQLLLEEAVKTKTGVHRDFTSLIAQFKQQQLEELSAIPMEETRTASSSDNELELDLLKEDLMCIICNGMDVGARNRLVECSDCHSLYHQECHTPIVSFEEAEDSWICQSCKDGKQSGGEEVGQVVAEITAVETEVEFTSVSPKHKRDLSLDQLAEEHASAKTSERDPLNGIVTDTSDTQVSTKNANSRNHVTSLVLQISITTDKSDENKKEMTSTSDLDRPLTDLQSISDILDDNSNPDQENSCNLEIELADLTDEIIEAQIENEGCEIDNDQEPKIVDQQMQIVLLTSLNNEETEFELQMSDEDLDTCIRLGDLITNETYEVLQEQLKIQIQEESLLLTESEEIHTDLTNEQTIEDAQLTETQLTEQQMTDSQTTDTENTDQITITFETDDCDKSDDEMTEIASFLIESTSLDTTDILTDIETDRQITESEEQENIEAEQQMEDEDVASINEIVEAEEKSEITLGETMNTKE